MRSRQKLCRQTNLSIIHGLWRNLSSVEKKYFAKEFGKELKFEQNIWINF